MKKIIFLFGLLIGCSLLYTPKVLAQPDTTILVRAIAGMQYDKVRLQVKPGSQVRLELVNEDDMSHNLVITQSGAREKVVVAGMALAENGPKMDFIPEIAEVLWSIPVVAPGEKKFVEFTAPSEEGILPFVCTYPGHGYIMYGAIYVTNSSIPPLSKDVNIPEHRRNSQMNNMAMDHKTMEPHPYKLVPPYYYRIFMPHASPASIAIRVSDNLSCCWDAGTCNLLYAWKGDFIDNAVAWKGHKNTESKILGTIYYRQKEDQILRFGKANQRPKTVEFKGYRLEAGYPVFIYEIDGYQINEKITISQETPSIVREFSIQNLDVDIYIPHDPKVKVSAGRLNSGYVHIPAHAGRHFSLTIKN